jgi:hypothetical protein
MKHMETINPYLSNDYKAGHTVRDYIKTVRRTLRTPLGVVRRVSGLDEKERSSKADRRELVKAALDC